MRHPVLLPSWLLSLFLVLLLFLFLLLFGVEDELHQENTILPPRVVPQVLSLAPFAL